MSTTFNEIPRELQLYIYSLMDTDTRRALGIYTRLKVPDQVKVALTKSLVHSELGDAFTRSESYTVLAVRLLKVNASSHLSLRIFNQPREKRALVIAQSILRSHYQYHPDLPITLKIWIMNRNEQMHLSLTEHDMFDIFDDMNIIVDHKGSPGHF